MSDGRLLVRLRSLLFRMVTINNSIWKIKELEDKVSVYEDRVLKLFDEGFISERLTAYTIASFCIDLEIEKAKVYKDTGDYDKINQCLDNSRLMLFVITKRFAKPSPNQTPSQHIPKVYQPLIDILKNKYNKLAYSYKPLEALC